MVTTRQRAGVRERKSYQEEPDLGEHAEELMEKEEREEAVSAEEGGEEEEAATPKRKRAPAARKPRASGSPRTPRALAKRKPRAAAAPRRRKKKGEAAAARAEEGGGEAAAPESGVEGAAPEGAAAPAAETPPAGEEAQAPPGTAQPAAALEAAEPEAAAAEAAEPEAAVPAAAGAEEEGSEEEAAAGAEAAAEQPAEQAQPTVEEPAEEEEAAAAPEQEEEAAPAEEEPRAAEQPAHAAAEAPPPEGPQVPGAAETGRVAFFYRPKIGVGGAAPAGLADVARFYMALAPHGGAAPGRKARLFVVGKKRLPEAGSHERFFGFVESVAGSLEELVREALGARSYETATRGAREVPTARAAGAGTYAIIGKPGGGRAHLAFFLEAPAEPGPAQEALGILPEGEFVLQVKNPANEPPSGPPLGLEEKAAYPEEKKKEFGSYAWIPATEDLALLDFERCEVLLVATGGPPLAALGEAERALAGAAAADAAALAPDADEEALLRALRAELGAGATGVDTAPLATGEWA
jgi:hypothetical protein